jgi:prepilin-type N-terminal cleavage/methylation domain-containing protein
MILSTRRSGARRGFTLVEVVVALAILTGALLGLSLFIARMAQATSSARLLGTATELASDRLELVKSATTYSTIDSLYTATETSIPGSPDYFGFTRKTLIQHVGGLATDSVDYKIITVIVTHVSLTLPVRKTTSLAAF